MASLMSPLGSAYRDVDATASNIKQSLLDSLENLDQMGLDKLLETRYQRLMSYGHYNEVS